MAYKPYGKGKPKFPKKERPILPPEHQLNPLAELAIESRSELKEYATTNAVTRDSTTIPNDKQRRNILAAIACAMASSQLGISTSNPDMPPFRKIRTLNPTIFYSPIYTTPIVWEHHQDFRYIPCFTRYVIDAHGRVLNAYNGKALVKEYGGYKLVPDGPSNALRNINLSHLMLLAFSILPDDFIDFGYGNYSHDICFNPETSSISLVKKPAVVVKNTDDGSVTNFSCIDEFIKSAEFDFVREIGEKVREYSIAGRTFINGVIKVGPYLIKEAEARTQPDLPALNIEVEAPRKPVADEFADMPAPSSEGFDEDIPF